MVILYMILLLNAIVFSIVFVDFLYVIFDAKIKPNVIKLRTGLKKKAYRSKLKKEFEMMKQRRVMARKFMETLKISNIKKKYLRRNQV